MSYLFGGSWIARGPVIEGAINGEVGAAGSSAAGGSPAGAGSSAHAEVAPAPNNPQANAAPETMLFLILFMTKGPFESLFRVGRAHLTKLFLHVQRVPPLTHHPYQASAIPPMGHSSGGTRLDEQTG
jgi:hypothetical protein